MLIKYILGTYQCDVTNNIGSIQGTMQLLVTETCLETKTPPQPNVQLISRTSVLLQWPQINNNRYLIEMANVKPDSEQWQPIEPNHVAVEGPSFLIEHLNAGDCYKFRLRSVDLSKIGHASPLINLPLIQTQFWQQEQFHRRYSFT